MKLPLPDDVVARGPDGLEGSIKGQRRSGSSPARFVHPGVQFGDLRAVEKIERPGHPYRLEIHHPPWSLQLAHATITTNTMAAASHLTLDGAPALLHFARRQDVVAWPPVRLAG